MTRRTFAVCYIALAFGGCLLGACGSVESVKEARGQGIKHAFKRPYEDVFAAVLNAAAEQKLRLISSARDSGTILLSSSASLSSLGGEHIAVFVVRLNDHASSVEIVVHSLVPGVSFPPDWAGLLFGDIEEALAAQRFPQ